MKSNMTSRSLGRLFLIAIVATLIPIVAQAAQTIRAPNVSVFTYNLAAGQTSPAFPVPANQPVQIMGTQLAVGFRGVAQATLLSIPGAGGFLEWTGLESTAGSVITQGFSGVAGTHILFLDFSHQVDIEVASPTAIRVTNSSAGVRNGTITMVW